ncbi:imidazolonepropionase [Natrarchaeobaculum sulfurireducens]|uniref:Imidazolonepropionase n=1 Tax=Natrarchaeobaculum sulfurireducens TaxID=2044521 RepID=A0A346PNP4_9EURY|nr:imidazolonepropionase [Natrarchaeobaculum sulfurireducens]AXR81139.1 Imidazolonepropionase [Natrarchaeobaculum sulfurireducens]
MTDADLVVHGAAELVVGPATGTTDGGHPGAHEPPTEPDAVLERLEDGAVAVTDGHVVAVGPTDEVVREYPPESANRAVDAAGRAVLPGFVDSHTHAVFAGDRSDEFAAKLRGKSYQEILAEGGGILRTVQATRKASADDLLERLLGHLDEALAGGATTVEVKSGYGLETDTERRLLEVIRRADDRHPVTVVPTFMGAHAVPDGESTDTYVDRVIEEQLPAVADLAAFCDVFCEKDVFSVDQSRRVLEAGREHGLVPKVHAEEFARLGGSRLAADLEAVSADHLLQATADDAAALAEAGVTPTLLPGTPFALGTEYADPRQFLAAGGEVALATDFNPNCYAPQLPFAATLACVEMGLSPAEAIRASTYAGGLALGADRPSIAAVPAGIGTLRDGAPGDLLVLEAPSHAHVPYRFGTSVVDSAFIGGELAFTAGSGVSR